MRLTFPIAALLIVTGCGGPAASRQSAADTSFYTPGDFARVEKIDAHVHIRTRDTMFARQAKRDNFRLLTIAVDEPPGYEAQEEYGIAQMRRFPQHVAFAATFSLNGWQGKDWEQNTIAHLRSAIGKGATGVKFYKNIGMELRDRNGRFVMIDDARFDTVLAFLTAHNIAVIGHFGEPKDCWLPLSQMLMGTNRKYYARHPEYHMYLHPDYPSYHEQIAARNRMLGKHPRLRFVGAHLGSQEWDTDTLARHLDQYPNMAVDMAARISSLQYLAMQNHGKVRAFFIRYQDRLIYGTDRISDGSKLPAEEAAFIHDAWRRDWDFFTGSDTLRSSAFEGVFKGLQLPKGVVDKIYRLNAEKWFRGWEH